ncbi:hypothetical protein B9Z55_007870 [Caenorhabditis nigoni]|uniref:BTB domain-containing protein n=1 Tax=Caenorhabditis nigoni TaxID=1611254 RepID=A0A2G5VBR3_9PELO|nr:hypothetical protein B9Z55_007870 [Caenorhabditis nigoni]
MSSISENPQPMDFSGTEPSLSDGIILVDGQKFHISKTHLARHSVFFKNLFFERGFQEANQEVVEIKEVSAEGFQIFLELINGQNRLSDETIEAVTQCSSMWQAEIPMKRCIKYLKWKSKLPKNEKFLLADKLDLNMLTLWLLGEVQTKADLENLLPPLDISVFKPNTVELIAKKSLKLNGIQRPPRATVSLEDFLAPGKFTRKRGRSRERSPHRPAPMIFMPPFPVDRVPGAPPPQPNMP